MAVIEIAGLTKSFGRVVAVDHLSFKVEQGGAVGFLGPNGAGKTTTLRMLLGLVTPSEGTATINGRPYRELPKPRHIVGALLESSNAYPGRTARNHLRIEAVAAHVSRSRVEEVLELVGLSDAASRRVGQFSLGMRQRLGLGTALLCDPEILILDEPANGLDPEGVRWLRQLLRSLASEGRTVLVSSHVLAEVAQTVDRVVILDQGRLILQSTLAELTSDGGNVTHVRTPQAEDLQTALIARGATVDVVASDQLKVSGATSEEIGTLAAENAIPIFESTTATVDLEDIFLRLTSGARGGEVSG